MSLFYYIEFHINMQICDIFGAYNYAFASQTANALLTRSQLNQPVVLKWSGATVAQQAG